jgi:hypothetical protein
MKDLDENLPRSQYSSCSSQCGDEPTCAICLDLIIEGDEIRYLPCSHPFHSKCVDIWLLGTLSDESLNTSICPTCRQEAISITPLSSASPSSQPSQSSLGTIHSSTSAIISPRPIYYPSALPSRQQTTSRQVLTEISESSNSSVCESTESNLGFRSHDGDIPREIFMRVGQYLLDESVIVGTPSPLMSPAIAPRQMSPLRQQTIPQLIPEPVRSRSSSMSSVSSSQSLQSSSSSVSSFLSLTNSIHSGSGVYIDFSLLSQSLDILSIASGA